MIREKLIAQQTIPVHCCQFLLLCFSYFATFLNFEAMSSIKFEYPEKRTLLTDFELDLFVMILNFLFYSTLDSNQPLVGVPHGSSKEQQIVLKVHNTFFSFKY